MLALSSGTAAAAGVPISKVLDISLTSNPQDLYNNARALEGQLAPPSDNGACSESAAAAQSYLRFARRSVEWFDRNKADPTFLALSESMIAAAHGVRSSLERATCATLTVAAPRNLPTDQPAPLSIWDRRITVYEPKGSAAATATIWIDGHNIGTAMVTQHRLDVLGPWLAPGTHVLRIDWFDESNTAVGRSYRQGIIALPRSAFVKPNPSTQYRSDTAASHVLERLRQNTPGSTAAYILDLSTGAEACTTTTGEQFVAASLLKLPILEAAFASGPQETRAYDVATIGGWSSNVAASRLISLVGESAIEAKLTQMGATNSRFSGNYGIGTAAPIGTSTCRTTGGWDALGNKVTTAHDVAMMLLYITRGGTTEASPAGRRILASLISSERSGDNRGIGLDALQPTTVAAVKNGWIEKNLFHTAAVLFLESGPRIVVTLTSGLDRTAANAFAQAVFDVALQMKPGDATTTDAGA